MWLGRPGFFWVVAEHGPFLVAVERLDGGVGAVPFDDAAHACAFNLAFIISARGGIVSRHTKLHLRAVDAPGREDITAPREHARCRRFPGSAGPRA